MKEKSTLKNVANNYLIHNQGEQGITLIALVITVIILIILTSITIGEVFGDGGLIKKTQLAKNMTLNSMIAEQEQLNSLMEELEKENETVTAEIEVTNRGEDTITVRVNGENLNKYQFSIDGELYTEEQSESEYTFAGLNKVIVNETNYKTTTGTEYTIYAKAKSSSGTEITCIPVTTSTIVEVAGDASKFTYENVGNEIYITGLNPNNENIIAGTENEIKEYIKEPKILLIPSYIEGKPVTKVSNNLFVENIGESGAYNEETLITAFNATTGEKILDNAVFANGVLNTPAYWPQGDVNFYCIRANIYGEGTGNAQIGATIKMKVKSSEIILPPRINEILKDTTQLSSVELLNGKNSIQYLDIVIDPDEGLESTLIDFDDPEEPDNCDIYVLGKDTVFEITNGEVLVEFTTWSGAVTVNCVN